MGKRADRGKLGLTDKAADGGPTLTPYQKLAEQYRVAFATDAGAEVLNDLKKRFGHRRSFVPDSNSTAFHEGQRDVYLLILSFIERDVNRTPTEETDG